MVDIVLLILGLVLFVALVVFHELGHAIAAKRNGVDVDEFGVGFPPRAWKKKLKNGTLLSLNWLPIGGFVRLKGEHDAAEGAGTYGGASLWVKTKILLAGVTINWLTAAAIFTLLALVGLPKMLPNQFTIPSDTTVIKSDVRVVVVENSPAAKAGLQTGDLIKSFAGQTVTTEQQLLDLTRANAGQTQPLVFVRNNKEQQVTVTLNAEQGNQGYLGVGPIAQTWQRSTWSAPIVGLGVTVQFTYETFKGLAGTVASLLQAKFAEAGQNVAGPVGIFSILKESSTSGIIPVMFLIGIISLTLAVMNVLPIPALDGGRLFVTLLFRLLKKQLTKEREEAIQTAGFAFLMLLVLVITIVDVRRFF
ncbi:MAG TPA: M50 family metallopeptidase [Candidatus Saccharimonadales bacterium]|nr:M50 family metallopeptidase [Candidatus Saccharimonadales bacterium]